MRSVMYGVFVLMAFSAAHLVEAAPSATLEMTLQGASVSGKVTAADNSQGLPGVNVVVKGTTTGTVTDSDGNYKITVPSGESVLVFSFIGYDTEETVVGNQAVIDIAMNPDVESLQEVVVVGYSTQKKVNLTGAVSTVSAGTLDARPLTSAASALQGTTSGVFVNQNSGQPGRDNISVNIRGIGTLNNSSPLVLVDGIEAPMNNINPDDIESMTVLKDAASASIYGSRAANGVILITTKRGDNTKGVNFNYNGYYGMSEAVRLPEMVTDGTKFAELWNEAKLNFGPTPKYNDAQMEDIAAINANTDWINELFSKAPIQQHNFSAAGSTDKTNFRFSFGMLDQEGVVPKADFKRYNGRLNLDTKVTDRLTIGTSLSLTRGDRNSSREDLTAEGDGSLIANAARSLPIDPIRNEEDGVLIAPKYGFNNVFMDLERSSYNVLSNEILGSAYAEYELIKGLKVKATAAINDRNAFDNSFTKTIEFYNPNTGLIVSDPATSRSRFRKTWKSQNLTTWVQATYERTIGSHYLKFLAGFNQETSKYDEFTASRSNFVSNSIPILNLGISNLNNSESATAWALQSYFGRVNYAFKDKYLFEANVRADGSSRFQNDKWGVFPAFSAGWILSEEDFFQVKFVDLVKVRASWGQLGNQNIGDFRYAKQLSLSQNYSFGGTLVPGAAQTSLGNPDLIWETTTTTDVGINLGLFDSRLELEADYFNRKTEDILYDIPIPSITGFGSNIYNSASVVNKGWEVALMFKQNFGDLGIEVGGNLTHVKSEVVELNKTLGDDEVDRKINGRSVLQRGSPVNSYFGYQADGIFRSQTEYDAAADHTGINVQYGVGDVRLVDIDGNGIIDDKDRTVIGKMDPTWIYGFNFRLKYKGFDLFALFQGAKDFQSYAEGELSQPFFNSAQLQSRWLDRWTPENPNAPMPRLYEGTGPSTAVTNSFWLLDRSYLRFKNLQLGYSFPRSILGKTSIKNVRIYVNAQNLFVITKFPYFDPERPANDPNTSKNEDRGGQGFPNLRIISGGLNINF
jgi:TonB-dependent starch-binding outer membrane protein SusC